MTKAQHPLYDGIEATTMCSPERNNGSDRLSVADDWNSLGIDQMRQLRFGPDRVATYSTWCRLARIGRSAVRFLIRNRCPPPYSRNVESESIAVHRADAHGARVRPRAADRHRIPRTSPATPRAGLVSAVFH